MRRNSPALLAVVIIVGLSLTGCASGAPQTAAEAGTIAVVASTNVYGDIAKQIGGKHVSVTSIITDPSQDPHSYEADAQVQLSLSKAHIVIQNGGGYDDFVTTLLGSAKNPDAVVLNATTISGYDQHPAAGEFNEHLWYDFPTVRKIAASLAQSFTAVDSGAAKDFTANVTAFDARMATLEADEASLKSRYNGEGVAITEPVPLYLLSAAGLENKTPDKFSEAIEAGSDVSPLVLQQTLKLFTDNKVKLLAYNAQTTGAETNQVIAAAKKAGIAAVPFTETLPASKDYLEWMTENLAAVKAALTP